MLGHRGCRLGITYPEITEMQARAIFEAAVAVAKDGVKVYPEVMIPLTATLKEMANQAAIVHRVAARSVQGEGTQGRLPGGTMIELPRAALVADEIAKEAQFFSFGTNDLTQTTFGFSRDDVNKVLADLYCGRHSEAGSVCGAGPGGRRPVGQDGDRARTEDASGSESRYLRRTRRRTVFGRVLPPVGLNYVSCSPFRVSDRASGGGPGGR